ncbi:MAG: FGGY family carbohydrate kinase, partial [Vicinamibacterales bacterium]|nr:FGGY family carbohydrate kinase [Vicinamibacterales bacterium]
MNTREFHVAIDLGAGSGRALVGGPTAGGFRCTEVHRFHYAPRHRDGHLRWDIGPLIEGMRTGVRLAGAAAHDLGGRLVSVGVDSWGVDYALLDAQGSLVEEPVCYRDARTHDAIEQVCGLIPSHELYARTGIQLQPFNTLYQLWAHVRGGFPAHAARLLLIPDYCHYVLSGSLTCERTNASTTQLLAAGTNGWDAGLFAQLGLPRRVMPEVVDAGTCVGTLTAEFAAACAVDRLRVVAPGTHDTASAVAGTPLEPGWAYISSGTWSLVGLERREPMLTADAALAGITNEAGVFGTTRVLSNVMGLWLLESCRREWEAEGRGVELPMLLDAVAQADGPACTFNPDDRRFFAPESMTREIKAALGEHGGEVVDDPARLTKAILDSLAVRYANVVSSLERLTGSPIPGIH